MLCYSFVRNGTASHEIVRCRATSRDFFGAKMMLSYEWPVQYKYHTKATCKTHLCLPLECGISVTSLYSYVSFKANSPKAAFGFSIYIRLGDYLAPFVIIILNYVRIYHVTLKQRRTQGSIGDFLDNTQQELVKKKREKDKASFIAVILACFFVCYGPGFLQAVIQRISLLQVSGQISCCFKQLFKSDCLLFKKQRTPHRSKADGLA